MAQVVGLDSVAFDVGDDGRVVSLADLPLALLPEGVGLLEPCELGLPVGVERACDAVGKRQQAHARLRLGLLEVVELVIGVADVDNSLIEVHVSP